MGLGYIRVSRDNDMGLIDCVKCVGTGIAGGGRHVKCHIPMKYKRHQNLNKDKYEDTKIFQGSW